MKNKTKKSTKNYNAKRNYKDTVFRMLFKEPENLLPLFNAINGTSYEDLSLLTVTTLENAVYMSVKNDVSCVVDMRLNMYEHQSSVNPNMPLRDLHYVSDTFLEFHAKEDIYSRKRILLPNPKFIVFYNGDAEQPARLELKLSDSYVHREENPGLELIVTQININPGYNDEFLENCPVLKDYMLYTDRVRTYRKENMTLTQAVDRAVDECISEGILAEFLMKNRAVVKNMSIYEYDEELHMKTTREEGYEDGYASGKEDGYASGKEDGYASGKVDGYTSGLEAGRESGYNSGKEDGYASGLEDGRQRGYNSGIETGMATGIATGIQGTITVLRSLDTPDTVIIEKIIAVYQISEEAARNYMNNN